MMDSLALHIKIDSGGALSVIDFDYRPDQFICAAKTAARS
jgi:hypothetical protein